MEPRTRSNTGSGASHDRYNTNSMKSTSESKSRSSEKNSTSSNARTNLSKKERDNLRAQLEANETEQVLKEFIAAFEEPSNKSNKTFIKGGVFNPGSHEETPTDRGKTYRSNTQLSRKSEPNPDRDRDRDSLQHKMARSNAAASAATAVVSGSNESRPRSKADSVKPKSNIETFTEELKRAQEERERRHAYKREKEARLLRSHHSDFSQDSESGHHEGRHSTEDPNTTNIFISTIPRAMNELSIMELFGRYGPLASVKIMYPRTDEEKSRGTNCGFVAYMSRKDAERAMHELATTQLESIPIRMSWGRSVHIPSQPVYIPPAMRDMITPPLPSGLPFNAQMQSKTRTINPQEVLNNEKELNKILENATVRVTIPHDRALLCLIHRMIEFVVREGPMFEAAIMCREINNPQYKFLFDNQSPAHTYYRWKLYSILQGDSVTTWRKEAFRLFKGGSLWLPPQPQQFTAGMPDEIFAKVKKETHNENPVRSEGHCPIPPPTYSTSSSSKRGRLSQKQRDHFEELLESLTPERTKIADAMLWAVDHAEAADEIIDCICQSLSVSQMEPYKKISRLYLISDILHNCGVKVMNASHYRRGFEIRLPDAFHHINQCWSSIDGRLRAEQFKQKVMSSFQAWESWAIYPSDFLTKLKNIFLGLVRNKTVTENVEKRSTIDEDIDGKPMNSDLSDNRPLVLVADYDDEEDIDGKPIGTGNNLKDDDIDGRPINVKTKETQNRPRSEIQQSSNKNSSVKPRFVATKWESVEPDQVAAQVVTISKWDFDNETNDRANESLYEDLAEKPISTDNSNSNYSLGNDENIRKSSSTSQTSSDKTTGFDHSSTSDLSEERRQKLRDVEIEVLKYTDELESGIRQRPQGLSTAEAIDAYRQSLLKKINDEEKNSTFSPDSSQSSNRSFRSNENGSSSSKAVSSSRHSQKNVDEKNHETSSRRDDSTSRHKSGPSRSNSSISNQTESTSRTSLDHQHKRKRDERSPSPSSRHARSSRR